MNRPREDLQTELQHLQQEREELQHRGAARQESIRQNRAMLAHLQRRDLFPAANGFLFKLALVIGVAGALFLAGQVWRWVAQQPGEQPPMSLVQQALPPTAHLLVISSPSAANVLVDGKMVGKTPYLHTVHSDSAKYAVRVEKPGYWTQQKLLAVSGHRGVQWKVEFLATSSGAEVGSGAQ